MTERLLSVDAEPRPGSSCSRCKGNGREPLANATIGAPACYLCGGTGQRTDPMVAVLADAIASARAEQPARGGESDHAAGRAVLSVPALAEVIARDAKVREIVGRNDCDPWEMGELIAALYPEAGK